MPELDYESIAIKAHQIWKREGQPNGRDVDHWDMAMQELLTDLEQGQDPATERAAVEASSLSGEQTPAEPVPTGRAVDDEDPDFSPIDDERTRAPWTTLNPL